MKNRITSLITIKKRNVLRVATKSLSQNKNVTLNAIKPFTQSHFKLENKIKNPLDFDSTARNLDNANKKEVESPLSNYIDNDELESGEIKTYRQKSKVQQQDKQSMFTASNLIVSIVLIGLSYYVGETVMGKYTALELLENEKYNEQDDIKTRVYNRILSLKDYFTKPKHQVLLPPQQVVEGQTILTTVLELDETLVKIVWDKEYGFRAIKRPGLDRFLGLLSFISEIVIFTEMNSFNAETLIAKLDPYRMYITHYLTKEHTTFIDGKIVKDLNLLNRDLNKVVVLDSNEDHCLLHPNNLIKVPAWDGNPNDTYLLDLLPFLETLALTDPKDVRVILEKYYDKDIPKALNELELEQRQKLAAKQSTGLRKWIGVESKSLPLTPIMLRRLELEKDYDSRSKQVAEQAKQLHDQALKEHMDQLANNKMTLWDSIIKTFNPDQK